MAVKTTPKQECPYCKCRDIIDLGVGCLENYNDATLNILAKARHRCGDCEREFLIYR